MAHDTTYKGINIEFNCTEFLPGRWIPSAILIDAKTGGTAPCTIAQEQHSHADAKMAAFAEARRRINAGTWRN